VIRNYKKANVLQPYIQNIAGGIYIV